MIDLSIDAPSGVPFDHCCRNDPLFSFPVFWKKRKMTLSLDITKVKSSIDSALEKIILTLYLVSDFEIFLRALVKLHLFEYKFFRSDSTIFVSR